MIYKEIFEHSFFSRQPLVQDPYESLIVRVQESEIPLAGTGLFAKRDIKVHTKIALYDRVSEWWFFLTCLRVATSCASSMGSNVSRSPE